MTRCLPQISLFSAFSLSLLFSGSAAAATDGTGDELGAYFRVLWGLLAVLGVILILYALLKNRFSVLNTRGNNTIKVLEIRPLMPKKALCLVEVRGKQYLLGLGAEQISLVAELPPKKTDSFSGILKQSQDRNQS